MSDVVETVFRLGGVASCDELRSHGHSLRDVDREVRRGAAERLRRGWIALPGAPADVVAAVTAGGVVSCLSALRRHAVWTGLDERLHVRVPRFAHLAGDAEPLALTFHRSLQLRDVVPARGGVDSLGWSIAHAVSCQQRSDAVASLDSVLHRGLMTRASLSRLLGQLPATFRDYLTLCDPRAESGVETRARLGLRAVNIRCRPQVRIDGVGRVDLLVGDRLVIEVDGARWHSGPDAVRADKARDLAAAERGYLVLRLTYEQVMFEWPRVVAVIRGMVARGEHTWSARHRRGGLVCL